MTENAKTRRSVGVGIILAAFMFSTIVPAVIVQLGPKEQFLDTRTDDACKGDTLKGFHTNGDDVSVADCERWAPITIGIFWFSMLLACTIFPVGLALAGSADRW